MSSTKQNMSSGRKPESAVWYPNSSRLYATGLAKDPDLLRGEQQKPGGPPLLSTAIITDDDDFWLSIDDGGRDALGVFETRKTLDIGTLRLHVRPATPEPEPELSLFLGDRAAD